MGKIVKIVAGIAIAAVAVALAAPTGGLSIAGALGLSGIAASVVGAIGAAVFATVATLALNALIPPPGTKQDPQNYAQSLADSQIIIGKCRAMTLKLAFFHPVGKDYRYFVWVVAGHRVKGLLRWYLNDEVVTVDGSGKVTSGKYAGNAWLWFERGDHDAVANPTFVAECGGKWTVDHRGRGIPKVYAKFKMTDDVVQAGRPVITCEVEGADEVYDPRTGTTGYSNNAILAFYWWMALPRSEGGFGCYPEEIDWDWVSAEANVCDEAVPLKAGGTEPRYTLDGFMATGADPSAVRSILIENMAGRFTYSGGVMLARPGYWVPVSTIISEDDLTDAVAYDLLAPADRRVTEITASWNDPDRLYVADDVPARSVPSDDVAQGSIDLPFVKSRTRVQRIQQIRLRQAAAERTLSVPMNIMGLGIAPMDTVVLRTARYASLGNMAWTVSNWSISQDYAIPLGLSEENEDMYEWSIADEIDRGAVQAIDRAQAIDDRPTRAAHQIVRRDVDYPVTSTDTTIDVVAFNGTLDDGRMIAFPAAHLGGLTNAATYLVLYALEDIELTLTGNDGVAILGADDQPITTTVFAGSYYPAAAPALVEAAISGFVIVRDVTTAGADGTHPPATTPPPGDGGGGYGGGGEYVDQKVSG